MALLNLLAASALALQAAPVPPRQIAPDRVRSVARGEPGMGVVLLSVRTQNSWLYRFNIWFEPVDDLARATGGTLRFSHAGRQGLRRMASTLASDAGVYAVPPGRWRLSAHAVGCDTPPSEHTRCFISGRSGAPGLLSSATYGPDWIEMTVAPGRLLDAGEFVLESPAGTVFESRPMTVAEMRAKKSVFEARNVAMRVKWRPIPVGDAAALQAAVAGVPRGGEVIVADDARSSLSCTRPPRELDADHLPFTC